jgi:hypothetical protein
MPFLKIEYDGCRWEDANAQKNSERKKQTSKTSFGLLPIARREQILLAVTTRLPEKRPKDEQEGTSERNDNNAAERRGFAIS